MFGCPCGRVIKSLKIKFKNRSHTQFPQPTECIYQYTIAYIPGDHQCSSGDRDNNNNNYEFSSVKDGICELGKAKRPRLSEVPPTALTLHLEYLEQIFHSLRRLDNCLKIKYNHNPVMLTDDDDEVMLNVLRCQLTLLGTNCDQCRSMVQYCFTFTETRRLLRTDSPGRPPRPSHSSGTMLC